MDSKNGFKESALRFLGPRDDPAIRNPSMREILINEAWEYIQVTEKRKLDLQHSPCYMDAVLNILAELSDKCNFLSKYLFAQGS